MCGNKDVLLLSKSLWEYIICSCSNIASLFSKKYEWNFVEILLQADEVNCGIFNKATAHFLDAKSYNITFRCTVTY